MTKTEMQAEALANARNGQTMTNYPAIFAGFIEKGIPEYEIKPRENVFTFHAWKALGRRFWPIARATAADQRVRLLGWTCHRKLHRLPGAWKGSRQGGIAPTGRGRTRCRSDLDRGRTVQRCHAAGSPCGGRTKQPGASLAAAATLIAAIGPA
jgi:hypothetical protein